MMLSMKTLMGHWRSLLQHSEADLSVLPFTLPACAVLSVHITFDSLEHGLPCLRLFCAKPVYDVPVRGAGREREGKGPVVSL